MKHGSTLITPNAEKLFAIRNNQHLRQTQYTREESHTLYTVGPERCGAFELLKPGQTVTGNILPKPMFRLG
jgi:hypothetical protein